MNYPICAIRHPLQNETTSKFRERRYEYYRLMKTEITEIVKARIEKEINHYIADGSLIVDR